MTAAPSMCWRVNYRHAFHAGNHADVLKHLALVFCLDRLKAKDAPFAVLDTHAGRGRYDLESEEARRSPEWQNGIGKLKDWVEAPAPVRSYLEAITRAAPFYPGSPLLTAQALRPQDRLIVCELHPEEYIALKRIDFGEARAEIHQRDGFAALTALLPPREKRGLVLIDPPYEATDETLQSVRALHGALHRFRNGIYLWWRPLKGESALSRADAELNASNYLRADLWIDTPAPSGKLFGSSLYVINPPFGLEAALRESLPPLAARLAIGPGAGWRIDASA